MEKSSELPSSAIYSSSPKSEISAGLDAETKAIVNKLLADYQAAGDTLIEVTHDQSEIDAAQKILRIEGGRVQV